MYVTARLVLWVMWNDSGLHTVENDGMYNVQRYNIMAAAISKTNQRL